MESTLTVKGERYGVLKVAADTQFHLARRIAPILAAMGISMDMLKKGNFLMPDLDELTTSFGPVSMVISRMDDETVNYLLGNCLEHVRRSQVIDNKETWVAVTTARAPTRPMFDDIDMPVMLRLVVEVLTVNLMGFSLGDGDKTPSTPS